MPHRRTGFFFDEKCLWHFGKPFALFFPVGGWVQPPNASGFCESPDSKRRLKSLMDVSGLTDVLDVRTAPMLAREDLARVHTGAYLDRFAELSAKDGGDLGFETTIGRLGSRRRRSMRW
jgi:acetoin utilization deacetylase AcuC-like enzyme